MQKIVQRLRYTVLVILATQSSAKENVRNYGGLLYDEDIPNVLFLFEDIKSGDSFELRKALRIHDVETLVLASPGGNVWEALTMAGTVFDKGLRVFVPNNAECVLNRPGFTGE